MLPGVFSGLAHDACGGDWPASSEGLTSASSFVEQYERQCIRVEALMYSCSMYLGVGKSKDTLNGAFGT